MADILKILIIGFVKLAIPKLQFSSLQGGIKVSSSLASDNEKYKYKY
jgi:hypothetical protein